MIGDDYHHPLKSPALRTVRRVCVSVFDKAIVLVDGLAVREQQVTPSVDSPDRMRGAVSHLRRKDSLAGWCGVHHAPPVRLCASVTCKPNLVALSDLDL